MHDAQLVAVLNSFNDGAHRLGRVLFTVLALFNNAIEQFAAGHLLHDEVVVAGLLEEVVQADDVGVAELLEDGHLVEEGRGVLFGELGPVDALDGEHPVAVAAVVALPDGGEGTGTELELWF